MGGDPADHRLDVARWEEGWPVAEEPHADARTTPLPVLTFQVSDKAVEGLVDFPEVLGFLELPD